MERLAVCDNALSGEAAPHLAAVSPASSVVWQTLVPLLLSKIQGWPLAHIAQEEVELYVDSPNRIGKLVVPLLQCQRELMYRDLAELLLPFDLCSGKPCWPALAVRERILFSLGQ